MRCGQIEVSNYREAGTVFLYRFFGSQSTELGIFIIRMDVLFSLGKSVGIEIRFQVSSDFLGESLIQFFEHGKHTFINFVLTRIVEINEFDYAETGVIYDQNGVTITSFPAIHIYDGPVSLRMDWNGLSFVYSGDTTPSQFFVDNAKNADLVVHETFNTVEQLIERSGYDEKSAKAIGTIVHSDPTEAGKVLEMVDPRMAVTFHFFNDFDLMAEMEAAVRTHYKGPLTLAQDLMVFNVTKDEIVTRMAITADHVWPNKAKHEGWGSAPRGERMHMSRWLADKQIFPKF